MKYCFGIDIGGTTVKMGLFQEDGELLDKWEIKTRTENQGEAILPDIAQAVKAKMAEKKLVKEQIIGLGMGLPAPVNEDGIVQNTANLGWGYKEVTRELEELLDGMKVIPGNDANVAALGEMWKGGGKGHKNVIMVTLGTGVGGGIIVDGKCLVGAHGAGGEIGHLCVNYQETETCGCGKKGCLEQYASATGITRLANMRLAKDEKPSTLRNVAEMSAKEVFDAVKAGDEVAIEIATEFGNYLGHALANLAAACDPAVIVIGGGVSKAGEVLLDYIKGPFKEMAFFADKDTEFALAELANDAGIIAQMGIFLAGAWLAISGKGVTAGVVIVFVQLMNYNDSAQKTPAVRKNVREMNAPITYNATIIPTGFSSGIVGFSWPDVLQNAVIRCIALLFQEKHFR